MHRKRKLDDHSWRSCWQSSNWGKTVHYGCISEARL